ncbi:MAG: iron transporter, partial [Rhodocyclaceae bacterium]|nr:iron transporter [Rhodocyclaceae bacterium]
MKSLFRLAMYTFAGLFASTALALEYPIGTPHNVAGMEVAAVYLQPIDM